MMILSKTFLNVLAKPLIKASVLVTALLMSGPFSSAQNALDISGFVAGDARLYTQDPFLDGQESNPDYSILFKPELRVKSRDENHQFTLIPFGRVDSRDKERTHFDIREAHWLYIGSDVQVLLGINKVFWGVAESRHLVDIINQTDLVEDLDGEDKLGQPMLQLTLDKDWGTWELYFLPYFRERTFVGEKGRLRSVSLIDADNPVFESQAEEFHPDVAIRYSHYFGDWDIGVSHFFGTSREPQFIVSEDGDRLSPYYSIIHQTGVDIQLTQEAWLYKVEAIIREGQGDTFFALTGGFEYMYYQVFGSNADIGLLAEYHYDGRDSRAPATASDNDFFGGMRFTLNDFRDTQLLIGMSHDPQTDESFYNIEAEARITDNLKAELRIRVFSGAVNSNEFLYPIESDDYIQCQLAYYF